MHSRRSDQPNAHSLSTNEPTKFYLVMVGGSLLPLIVVALLPAPWNTDLFPFVAVMLIFVLFYGLALVLQVLSLAWHMIKPIRVQPLRCPACRSAEDAWRPFGVVRVAPDVFRVRCTECGERWVERK